MGHVGLTAYILIVYQRNQARSSGSGNGERISHGLSTTFHNPNHQVDRHPLREHGTGKIPLGDGNVYYSAQTTAGHYSAHFEATLLADARLAGPLTVPFTSSRPRSCRRPPQPTRFGSAFSSATHFLEACCEAISYAPRAVDCVRASAPSQV